MSTSRNMKALKAGAEIGGALGGATAIGLQGAAALGAAVLTGPVIAGAAAGVCCLFCCIKGIRTYRGFDDDEDNREELEKIEKTLDRIEGKVEKNRKPSPLSAQRTLPESVAANGLFTANQSEVATKKAPVAQDMAFESKAEQPVARVR